MKQKKLAIVCELIIILLAMNFIFAETTTGSTSANYCCEKTLAGAFCQNAPQEQCDLNFKTAPTSCESTSYCKPGCCFDTKEGLCMESTPQRVCEASNGSYAASSQCQIPQCNLGCCVLGNQGAFVTLTRCKAMSGFYGLKTDFRQNIKNELSCIATAQSQDVGACVYDNSVGGKTCKFTSRAACSTAGLGTELANLTTNNTQVNGTAQSGFYKDTLCTAPELGTDCGKSTNTMLIQGKDEVYYNDSCGNPANIYDASKYNDPMYWKKVYKKSESCGYGSSNAGSSTCGNCDYYLGSIGKRATGILGRPTYGNFICVDLSCKAAGKKHGESWCVSDSPTGNGEDSVGSRYYKEVCLYNEVITEPCADYRNEICIQGSTGSFTEAACRVNRWQDCMQQKQESDCTNEDVRDCMWIPNFYYSSSSSQIEKSTNDSNNDGNTDDPTPKGLCVPNYPPGFNFWGTSQVTATPSSSATPVSAATGNSSTGLTPAFTNPTATLGTGYVSTSSGTASGSGMCTQGNAALTVKWERTKKPLAFWQSAGDWVCVENCQYAKSDTMTDEEMQAWAKDMNEICYKLGDCGGYINWVNQYTDNGYAAYYNNKRVAGSGGQEIIEKGKTTSGSSTTSPTLSNATGATTPAFTNPTK